MFRPISRGFRGKRGFEPRREHDLALDAARMGAGVELAHDPLARRGALRSPKPGVGRIPDEGIREPGDRRRAGPPVSGGLEGDELSGAVIEHLDDTTNCEGDDRFAHRHRLDHCAGQRVGVDARDDGDVEIGDQGTHVRLEPEHAEPIP